MPIGGFVIHLDPSMSTGGRERLAAMEGVEIFGNPDDPEVIAVLSTATSREMERLVEEIEALEFVLSVSLAYLNTEDEVLQSEGA